MKANVHVIILCFCFVYLIGIYKIGEGHRFALTDLILFGATSIFKYSRIDRGVVRIVVVGLLLAVCIQTVATVPSYEHYSIKRILKESSQLLLGK